MITEYVTITSRKGLVVRVFLDEPCICGDTRTFRMCCHTRPETERPTSASTSPEGPRTGFSHPKCYASALGDCDDELTREHYISAVLTRTMAALGTTGTIVIRRPGQAELSVPPARAFQSKILCRRHNGALGPLDATSDRFFRALLDGANPAPSRACMAFAGPDIEKWMLKVACGFRALEGDELPRSWLEILFGVADFVHPAGLQMVVPIGARVPAEHGVEFGTYRNERGAQSGVEIAVQGIRFTLSLNDRSVYRASDIGAKIVYHPGGVWFTHGGKGALCLSFAWGDRPRSADTVSIEVNVPAVEQGP